MTRVLFIQGPFHGQMKELDELPPVFETKEETNDTLIQTFVYRKSTLHYKGGGNWTFYLPETVPAGEERSMIMLECLNLLFREHTVGQHSLVLAHMCQHPSKDRPEEMFHISMIRYGLFANGVLASNPHEVNTINGTLQHEELKQLKPEDRRDRIRSFVQEGLVKCFMDSMGNRILEAGEREFKWKQ